MTDTYQIPGPKYRRKKNDFAVKTQNRKKVTRCPVTFPDAMLDRKKLHQYAVDVNYFVPKSIDSGTPDGLAKSLVMARKGFKCRD